MDTLVEKMTKKYIKLNDKCEWWSEPEDEEDFGLRYYPFGLYKLTPFCADY